MRRPVIRTLYTIFLFIFATTHLFYGWTFLADEKTFVPHIEKASADFLGNVTIFVSSTASTSWTVPSDWNNASNTIEVIGGGGGGGTSANNGDGGGGGGAYAIISNYNVGASTSILIQVGTGGTQNNSGTISFFGGSGATTTCTGKAVCAQAGGRGGPDSAAGTGGASSTSIGSTTYKGGDGGTGNTTGDTGGGGGGAAGPLGNGANGGNGGASTGSGGGGGGGAGNGSVGQNASSSAGNGGRGGNGPGGSGGGAGGSGAGGTAGTAGTGGGGGAGDNDFNGAAGATYNGWASGYGPGGGGGGSADAHTGSAGVTSMGGLYGAGGGGADGAGSWGQGAQGIIVITYSPISSYEQSAYKWYSNNNSSTPGAELTPGTQDASTTLSSDGAEFRLRLLLHVDLATSSVGSNSFKLQYASTSPGNCTPEFYSDSAFTDVTTSTGEIRFNNNAGPADGAIVVSTSTDLTHGGDTRVNQTYEEQNNFTVTSTISAGQDGKWDFSLIDAAAPDGTTYCFRIVKSDGTFISTTTSSKIPEIKMFAANSAPTVSAVVLNGASAIILSPNATQTVNVVASTSDAEGAGDIQYATGTIYRSGVSGGAACSSNNLNCYHIASTSCSFSGSTSSVTCTAHVYYFAQATDASSSFSGENWLGRITVADVSNATGSSSTASGVELNTLLAIDVTPTSTSYGTLSPGADTGSTNQTSSVKNAGNASTTLNLSGTALSSGGADLATSSQHYATSSFTFGGAEQQLSGTQTAVSGFLLTSPTSTSAVSSLIYWGIEVANGKPQGTYTGTNVFTAVFSP